MEVSRPRQQELFSDERVIPGFSIEPEYLSRQEERELLVAVETGPWETDYRRRIQQYGLGYGSQLGGAPTWIRDFPPWLSRLAQRVTDDGYIEHFPDNSVVNEYIPPLGIGLHKDYDAFGSTVVCLSLGSEIVLDFMNPAERSRIPVFVPARSLWVITGEARSQWMHGIAPRLNDVIAGERRRRGRRVSITFRTAKERKQSWA